MFRILILGIATLSLGVASWAHAQDKFFKLQDGKISKTFESWAQDPVTKEWSYGLVVPHTIQTTGDGIKTKFIDETTLGGNIDLNANLVGAPGIKIEIPTLETGQIRTSEIHIRNSVPKVKPNDTPMSQKAYFVQGDFSVKKVVTLMQVANPSFDPGFIGRVKHACFHRSTKPETARGSAWFWAWRHTRRTGQKKYERALEGSTAALSLEWDTASGHFQATVMPNWNCSLIVFYAGRGIT